jgi:hypothetical protein
MLIFHMLNTIHPLFGTPKGEGKGGDIFLSVAAQENREEKEVKAKARRAGKDTGERPGFA